LGFTINLLTSPSHLWFWPLLGWGIGVFHGMKVFNYMPFLGRLGRAKKIKEFMEKREGKDQNRWK
jgi:uncharacterized membrane protein YbhN (UPF0104 family)